MLDVVRTIRGWHWPLAAFTASMAVLAVVAAVGYFVDDRVITGAPAWAKPFKFALSFGIYGLTLAWMIPMIPRPRWRRVAWWAGAVAALTSFVEVGAITLQAARGTTSHYNFTTAFNGAVFTVMGVMVTLIYLSTLVIGATLLRSKVGDTAFSWALRLGMVISLAGLSVGFLMLLPTPEQAALGEESPYIGAHAVGVADGGPGVNLLGWSTTGGDLRIGHFIGMHGLQVLPLVAMVLALPALRRFVSARARVQAVVLVAVVYLGVTVLAVWQAMREQPLMAPDGLTWGAAGSLVGVAVVGVLAIAVGVRRSPAAAPAVGGPGAAAGEASGEASGEALSRR